MKGIRLILQGGGTRCAYQLALLKKLLNNQNFKDNYYIDKIYGTSFGAIVGYFICINRIDILENFFNNISKDSLKPWFDLWGIGKYVKKIPLLGKLFGLIIDAIWLLLSVKNKSLFNPNYGIDILDNDTPDPKKLECFNCCVYNITKERTEIINGSHPLIKEYIIASSSLWIIFPPKKIRMLKTECVCNSSCKCNDDNDNYCTCDIENHKFNEFLDGGVIKPIPLHVDENFSGKYLVLTTRDVDELLHKNLKFNHSGNHLFEYLDNLITFLVDYIQHIDINISNWHNDERVILINYKPKNNSPVNLDKETINEFIKDGEKYYEKICVDLGIN